MITKVAGRVRGLFNLGNYPENREDEQFHLSTRGDQLVSQGLPELTELVRLGQSWQVKTTTGIAALSALPTTVNGLGLYNANPATGACYVIDSVASWEAVVDAGAGPQSQQTTLFAMLNKGTLATIPTATALTPVSLAGRTNYDGRASLSPGATVVNDGWYPVGTSAPSGVTAAAGAVWKQIDVPLRGQYIVPPGTAFSIAATKIAGGALGQFYCIRWHEVQLLWRP